MLERFELAKVIDASVGGGDPAPITALLRDGAIEVDLSAVSGIQLHFDTASELVRTKVRPEHPGYVDRSALPAPCQQQLAVLSHTEVARSTLYNICTQIALALSNCMSSARDKIVLHPMAFKCGSDHCGSDFPGPWTHTEHSIMSIVWQSGPGIEGLVCRDGVTVAVCPPADKRSVIVWFGDMGRKPWRHRIRQVQAQPFDMPGEWLAGGVHVDDTSTDSAAICAKHTARAALEQHK